MVSPNSGSLLLKLLRFSMIVFGLYLLFTADVGSSISFSNLWSHGGFFPNGFSGLFYMLAFLMFAFGGIELIGMAAVEAKRSENHSKSN